MKYHYSINGFLEEAFGGLSVFLDNFADVIKT